MDNRYYIYIVLLSFLMTYPIRSIPALFISKLNLTPYWQRFLDLVPYTALTALVFPGVFYCIENNQYAAYIGTAIAIVAASARMSLSIVVLVAVAGAYITIVAS
ncbi:MAG: AzlD domain-containing protein [Succinivibrio sp.]